LRLLLDTHIVIWAALDPTMLSGSERELMARADTTLVLSAVAVWELRLKWHSFHISGSRKGPINPAVVVSFAEKIGWTFLPLTSHHAMAALIHPLPHKDPFDELLLVQAQEEAMRLLTRDSQVAFHPLALTLGRT
jgi:PIN domain nuclease of toxin-antitoxin system